MLGSTELTLPADSAATAEHDLLRILRREPRRLAEPAVAARARTLWAASLFIDDVVRLQTRLRAGRRDD